MWHYCVYVEIIMIQSWSNGMNTVFNAVFKIILPPFHLQSVFAQVVSFLIFFPFLAFYLPFQLCPLESALGPPEFNKNNNVFIFCVSLSTWKYIYKMDMVLTSTSILFFFFGLVSILPSSWLEEELFFLLGEFISGFDNLVLDMAKRISYLKKKKKRKLG